MSHLLSNRPGPKYYLHGVTDKDTHRFWSKYKLQIEEDVFTKGVLFMRHLPQLVAAFENEKIQRRTLHTGLKIGNYEYTELEWQSIRNSLTRNKWETVCNLSRLHWILIVACIFAAMTQ